MDDLEKFLNAQDAVFPNVLAELQSGEKKSHWMWFVFPQLRGLGNSAMAMKFGLSGISEAKAYLLDAVLGPRLITCTRLVNAIEGRTIEDIFGYPDNLKFRSSMTLFAAADPIQAEFKEALSKYFGGKSDQNTLARLEGS